MTTILVSILLFCISSCVSLPLPTPVSGSEKFPQKVLRTEGEYQVLELQRLSATIKVPSEVGEWFEKNPAENKKRIVLYSWKNDGMQMMVPIYFADEDTPASFDAWERETKASRSLYSRGEYTVLADGFDVYYSYYYRGQKRTAYYSQRTINDQKFSCADAGLALFEMKRVRRACRSIAPM